jgi:hypothetical protein
MIKNIPENDKIIDVVILNKRSHNADDREPKPEYYCKTGIV